MASITCELVWLKFLLKGLGVSHLQLMTLHCDNKATLHIVANPVYHEHTKHIDIDCHLVHEKLQVGLLHTQYVSSNNQLAHIFTKVLGIDQFRFLSGKLGIHDIHSPT